MTETLNIIFIDFVSLDLLLSRVADRGDSADIDCSIRKDLQKFSINWTIF